MANSEFTTGEIKALCPQCGPELLIEQNGIELKPQDRVFCPVHGTIGTRQEIHAKVLDQHKDKIVEHAIDAVREMFKGRFDVR